MTLCKERGFCLFRFAEKDPEGYKIYSNIERRKPAAWRKTRTRFVYQNARYKITKVLVKSKTITYLKSVKRTRNAVIPQTVTYQNKVYQVTAVEKNAFKGNKKLQRAVIGANVKKIGKFCFENARKLKIIVFRGKIVPKIEKKAFQGIQAKAAIRAPKSDAKKYKKALTKKRE